MPAGPVSPPPPRGGEAPAPGDGAAHVAALAAGLRRAGVNVGTGQVTACAAALAEVDPKDVAARYWTGRVCLCSEPAHLPVYDRVFAAVLSGGQPEPPTAPVPAPAGGVDAGSDRPGGADPGGGDEVHAGGLAMAHERLRHRRFDRLDQDERAEVDRLVDALRLRTPARRTRRRMPGPGGDLDLARTLDRAMRFEGEVLQFDRLTRRPRPRPLVVVLDVSGSMAAFARPLLRFAVAAASDTARPRRRVEVFAFGTRLTRLTDALAVRDPDAALADAAARVVDWDGGTRIAASLEQLVRVWGRRGLLRGAVVLLCSDGLERGDGARLGATVARLRRSVHRLVWVNPLAGDPRYAPTQRGMAAALPHVDVFVPGHDLASLEDLVDVLAGLR
ncbi:VWA domain-containing protein [Egicoccus sp. AB-alg2]|uniref:vWA domain-containing protein n=1 Tax=Egicoccus sp. AB-alg2 TaxID=3242693 RepID=UPI00359D6C6A